MLVKVTLQLLGSVLQGNCSLANSETLEFGGEREMGGPSFERRKSILNKTEVALATGSHEVPMLVPYWLERV